MSECILFNLKKTEKLNFVGKHTTEPEKLFNFYRKLTTRYQRNTSKSYVHNSMYVAKILLRQKPPLYPDVYEL